LEYELKRVVFAREGGGAEQAKQDGSSEHRERLRYRSAASK